MLIVRERFNCAPFIFLSICSHLALDIGTEFLQVAGTSTDITKATFSFHINLETHLDLLITSPGNIAMVCNISLHFFY